MSGTRTQFTVLIPARLASTRLPDKALADLGGKPLIVRVADQAARSGAEVIVATDDAAIVQVLQAAGHHALLTRRDHTCGTDRLAEAVAQLGLAEEALIVNLQGDEPEIAPDLLTAVATRLQDDNDAAIATCAHPITSVSEWLDPNVVKVIADQRGHALCFSRAPIPFARDAMIGFPQRLPTALPPFPAGAEPLRHIGLYAYRAGFLRRYATMPPAALEVVESLEQLRALAAGYAIALELTSAAPSAGIDTPADLEAARKRLRLRADSESTGSSR